MGLPRRQVEQVRIDLRQWGDPAVVPEQRICLEADQIRLPPSLPKPLLQLPGIGVDNDLLVVGDNISSDDGDKRGERGGDRSLGETLFDLPDRERYSSAVDHVTFQIPPRSPKTL